jgi:signal peptidase I
MKKRTKQYLMKAVEAVAWVVNIGALLVVLYAVCRIFICDQFIIPSQSMNPTLIPGDRILADKLIFGGRIYKKYDFSEGEPLESWRMPGFRKIKVGDVLVFNAPNGYGRGKIEFKINYVFAKRCIAIPGDTVSAKNGFYHNSGHEGIIGVYEQQRLLAMTPDSLLPDGVREALPFDHRTTIKNFGPIYVPARGDTMHLAPSMYRIYKNVIEYESGKELSIKNGRLLLDNLPIEEYIFKENYYFAGGDNVSDSGDSRYWGLVPEEYIIGIARRISYSRDRNTGAFRWDRFWKKIE